MLRDEKPQHIAHSFSQKRKQRKQSFILLGLLIRVFFQDSFSLSIQNL